MSGPALRLYDRLARMAEARWTLAGVEWEQLRQALVERPDEWQSRKILILAATAAGVKP